MADAVDCFLYHFKKEHIQLLIPIKDLRALDPLNMSINELITKKSCDKFTYEMTNVMEHGYTKIIDISNFVHGDYKTVERKSPEYEYLKMQKDTQPLNQFINCLIYLDHNLNGPVFIDALRRLGVLGAPQKSKEIAGVVGGLAMVRYLALPIILELWSTAAIAMIRTFVSLGFRRLLKIGIVEGIRYSDILYMLGFLRLDSLSENETEKAQRAKELTDALYAHIIESRNKYDYSDLDRVSSCNSFNEVDSGDKDYVGN